MNPRTIYLVRHGHRVHAGEKAYIGVTDVPLSEEGRAQAKLLGQALWERGFRGRVNPAPESPDAPNPADERFVRLLSSPLTRCAETASFIQAAIGGDLIISDGFREIDLGSWEGRRVAEVRTKEPEAFEARGKMLWQYRTPGGESFREAGIRFLQTLDDAMAAYPEDLMIVCHAGVIRAVQALLRADAALNPAKRVVLSVKRDVLTTAGERSISVSLTNIPSSKSSDKPSDKPSDEPSDAGETGDLQRLELEKRFFAEWMQARVPDYAEVVRLELTVY